MWLNFQNLIPKILPHSKINVHTLNWMVVRARVCGVNVYQQQWTTHVWCFWKTKCLYTTRWKHITVHISTEIAVEPNNFVTGNYMFVVVFIVGGGFLYTGLKPLPFRYLFINAIYWHKHWLNFLLSSHRQYAIVRWSHLFVTLFFLFLSFHQWHTHVGVRTIACMYAHYWIDTIY